MILLKTFSFIIFYFLINYHLEQDYVRPNIIFYLADDQDQIDYGVYGNNLVKTPAVDKLAKEGMLFSNAYTTQAICAPTRSMLYTGLYPMKNGCMANHLPVKPELKDVNDFFNELGYDVVLAGKGHVKPNSVFNWSKYFPNILLEDQKNKSDKQHGFSKKNIPLEKIESYIEKANKPFLMFVASDYPHGPYPKKTNYDDKMIFNPPYDKKFPMYNKKGYYKNIESDNNQLESLIELLDKSSIKKNTLFIYAADHGIRGKWGVSEVGLKIPLVMKWPKYIKPGSVIDGLVNIVDILPTLIEIAGGKVSENLDGKSFKEAILNNSSINRKYVYGISTLQNIMRPKVFPSRSIRNERFKYIVNFNSVDVYKENMGENPYINEFIKIGAESFPNKPYEEFYDLDNDPYELNNLINKNHFEKEIGELKQQLKFWMESQNDFLINHKMPLIKPANFPLDRPTNLNKVEKSLAIVFALGKSSSTLE